MGARCESLVEKFAADLTKLQASCGTDLSRGTRTSAFTPEMSVRDATESELKCRAKWAWLVLLGKVVSPNFVPSGAIPLEDSNSTELKWWVKGHWSFSVTKEVNVY